MGKIILLPHKHISKELNDDLRNKFSTIDLILANAYKSRAPQFVKMALNDLNYIEVKLNKFELRNKLPRIKIFLDDILESKESSIESFKFALEDYEYIKKVLDPSSILPFTFKVAIVAKVKILINLLKF